MRVIRITSTAILSLLLGIAAPAYAQHEQQGEKQDHPQQQSKHEQAKPEKQHAQQQKQSDQKQQQHAQQQRQSDQKQQQQHAQQQKQSDQKQQKHAQQQRQSDQKQQQQHARQQRQSDKKQQQQHAQQQRGHEQPQHAQEQQRVRQTAWQQHRARSWQSDHRTWQQRGGYHGYRIPDDRFRGHFGPDHGFRIYGLPFLVVGGYPRFQYGGYWFILVDPWPEYWANDWYDTDDVYDAYDSGYYLFNRRYPDVGIAINISR